MFGFGRRDRNGDQVRLEHRGRNLRASRTGGLSARTQHKIGGVTVTANTKHGLRASAKVAPGLRIANQSGRWQMIGRWSRGPFRYNLSKRGGSVSVTNRAGALNLTNPGRSSFKAGGIQLRGRKAANLQLIYLAVMAAVALVRIGIWLCALPVVLVKDLLGRHGDPDQPDP
ncbi:hypothetical protein [Paracoccus sp. ME4]|uniref:hypothetical protein n=1 Tax=Paracoccus sp. ME4 TaxID=3138066 RepID=UPI00398B148B